MRVGISNDNYPEKRTIKVDPNNEYVNFKYRNIYSYINFLTMRILKKRRCSFLNHSVRLGIRMSTFFIFLMMSSTLR